MNKNITAIAFMRNEEHRIRFVYENLKDFCEIIVFDGGSTDGTEEFCLKNGIKFILRPEDNTEMRLESMKWAFLNTPTEYVLLVYGAHIYPKNLLNFFSKIADENVKTAVYNDVVIYRYGAVVHRPLFRRIPSVCNFFRKSIINFEKSKIHDELAIQFNEEEMIRLPGRDDLSLHLFQDDDCENYTKKTINYAAIEARQRYRAGERIGVIELLTGPLFRFVYRYFRTGSFVNGDKGLIYSILNMIYDLHVSIILWELTNNVTLVNSKILNSDKKIMLLESMNK